MKSSRALAVASVLLFALLPTLRANEPSKPIALSTLEKKLVGAWIGESPCAGDLVFQADGTYHYADFGPGGGAFETGIWKVDWNELPPTLILTQSFSNLGTAQEVGKYHLLVLNEKELHFRYPGSLLIQEHHRGTERDDVAIRICVLDFAVQNYLGADKFGAGVNLPPSLKTLVEKKILSAGSLVDPWGREFQYDVTGKRNQGTHPDIWTSTKDQKGLIGNWSEKK